MAIAKPASPRLRRGSRIGNGIVGAWTFYEGSGTRLNETSDSYPAYFGTFAAGAAAPTWGGGADGSALTFVAGSSQYIALPAGTQTTYAFTSSLTTIYARYKCPASPVGIIMSCDGASTSSGWYLQAGGTGTFAFTGKGSGGSIVVTAATTNTFIDNQYHDIVAVFFLDTNVGGPNSTVSIYVDGVFQITASAAVNAYIAPTTFALIGARGGASPATFLSGDLSQIILWNRGLSQTEISELSVDPFKLFRIRRVLKSSAVVSTIKFRKTASRIGTRTGTRQTWAA